MEPRLYNASHFVVSFCVVGLPMLCAATE